MRVGISGHQDLGSAQTIDWIRHRMLEHLGKWEFSSGVSSLAAGADQLFAQAVLELGKDLEVVIPCHNYEATFDASGDAEVFRNLKQRAIKCYQLEFTAPSEQAFYRAGCQIVDMSNMMLFVWNGEPAKGFGGTADIVSYARRHGKAHVLIDPAGAAPTES